MLLTIYLFIPYLLFISFTHLHTDVYVVQYIRFIMLMHHLIKIIILYAKYRLVTITSLVVL